MGTAGQGRGGGRGTAVVGSTDLDILDIRGRERISIPPVPLTPTLLLLLRFLRLTDSSPPLRRHRTSPLLLGQGSPCSGDRARRCRARFRGILEISTDGAVRQHPGPPRSSGGSSGGRSEVSRDLDRARDRGALPQDFLQSGDAVHLLSIQTFQFLPRLLQKLLRIPGCRCNRRHRSTRRSGRGPQLSRRGSSGWSSVHDPETAFPESFRLPLPTLQDPEIPLQGHLSRLWNLRDESMGGGAVVIVRSPAGSPGSEFQDLASGQTDSRFFDPSSPSRRDLLWDEERSHGTDDP